MGIVESGVDELDIKSNRAADELHPYRSKELLLRWFSPRRSSCRGAWNLSARRGRHLRQPPADQVEKETCRVAEG